MTNEAAWQVIHDIRNKSPNKYMTFVIEEALDTSMEALLIKKCPDSIDRANTIKAINEALDSLNSDDEIKPQDIKELLATILQGLPTVQPAVPDNIRHMTGWSTWAFNQVVWERDMAFKKLKELGYKIGV